MRFAADPPAAVAEMVASWLAVGQVRSFNRFQRWARAGSEKWVVWFGRLGLKLLTDRGGGPHLTRNGLAGLIAGGLGPDRETRYAGPKATGKTQHSLALLY